MKKTIIGIVAVLVIVVAIVANNKPEENTNGKPVVKIGALLPLTGDISMFGEGVKLGIQKAIEDTEKTLDYKVVFEDTQFKSKNINMIAHKFSSLDKVDVMMSMWSVAANIVNRTAENSETLHLTCAWGDKAAEGLYNFNTYSSMEDQYSVLLKYFKSQQVKKIAIFTPNITGATEISDYVNERLKLDGVEVAFFERFNVGEKDFKLVLSKIKNKKDLDMLFLLANPPEVHMITKQMAEMNWDIPMTSIDTFTGVEDLFEGQSQVMSSNGKDTLLEEYLTNNGAILHPCAVNQYVSMALLINVYEKIYAELGRVPSGEEVANELIRTGKYSSVIGDLTVKENGVISPMPFMVTIKNGKKIMIGR